ncbi:hypothetical protein [Microbacterium sp. 77mftsu3.1]|uniref:hypothetical protein n=1 Tax=Microbacterium sp. 77mftsu3.1 TaxID=1761802 RepID=UPI000380F86C|nr:hypothetical protein [Microbacterium sp. 77mftsu3.1]SDH47650.1 hypothetical protein SAMN04488590_3388 [Microbacterium sp. 77mftsu3.1]
MSHNADDTASKISASIHLGIYAEEGDPAMTDIVSTLTKDQVSWIGLWLASEGFRAPAPRRR